PGVEERLAPAPGLLELGQLLLARLLGEQTRAVAALAPALFLLHPPLGMTVEKLPGFGLELGFRDDVGHLLASPSPVAPVSPATLLDRLVKCPHGGRGGPGPSSAGRRRRGPPPDRRTCHCRPAALPAA